jgi:Bifunctional DNA primase/polymerase, N-terminal
MAVLPVRANREALYQRGLIEHGVLDATTDEATIRRWWDRWPHADCGWSIPDDIVVIDLDEKNGQRGIANFEKREGVHPLAIETPIARTLTGGLHLVCSAGGKKYANVSIGFGDLKTVGGYIVLPGPDNGRHWIKPLSTALALVPSWVPTARVASITPQGPARQFEGETPYSRAALRRAVQAIEKAPCGAQEMTLNKECFSIGMLVGGGVIDVKTAVKALTAAAGRMKAYRGPWRNLDRKVSRAIEDGMQKPRQPEARS